MGEWRKPQLLLSFALVPSCYDCGNKYAQTIVLSMFFEECVCCECVFDLLFTLDMTSEILGWTLDTSEVSSDPSIQACIRANKNDTYETLNDAFDAFLDYIQEEGDEIIQVVQSDSDSDISLNDEAALEEKEGEEDYQMNLIAPTMFVGSAQMTFDNDPGAVHADEDGQPAPSRKKKKKVKHKGGTAKKKVVATKKKKEKKTNQRGNSLSLSPFLFVHCVE